MLQIYIFEINPYTKVMVVSDSEKTARDKVKEHAADSKMTYTPVQYKDEDIELEEVIPIVEGTLIWQEL